MRGNVLEELLSRRAVPCSNAQRRLSKDAEGESGQMDWRRPSASSNLKRREKGLEPSLWRARERFNMTLLGK